MKTTLLALLLTFICAAPVVMAVLILLAGLAQLFGSGNAADGIIASAIIALILLGVFHVIDTELSA